MGQVMEWLMPALKRAEFTHSPRPDGNVTDFTGGLDKLRKAIMSVQREITTATEQAAAYEQAWTAAQMEYQAAVEKNRLWQEDAQQRLYKLQSEWITVTEPLGITSQIDRSKP